MATEHVPGLPASEVFSDLTPLANNLHPDTFRGQFSIGRHIVNLPQQVLAALGRSPPASRETEHFHGSADD